MTDQLQHSQKRHKVLRFLEGHCRRFFWVVTLWVGSVAAGVSEYEETTTIHRGVRQHSPMTRRDVLGDLSHQNERRHVNKLCKQYKSSSNVL